MNNRPGGAGIIRSLRCVPWCEYAKAVVFTVVVLADMWMLAYVVLLALSWG